MTREDNYIDIDNYNYLLTTMTSPVINMLKYLQKNKFKTW